MNKQKEMTARNTSVGADDRQSLNVSVNIITAYHLKINSFVWKGGGRMAELKIISMDEVQSKEVNWL